MFYIQFFVISKNGKKNNFNIKLKYFIFKIITITIIISLVYLF